MTRVFVLSYEGDIQDGISIASELASVGADVTLIFSGPEGLPQKLDTSFASYKAENDSFFGGKFAIGLELGAGSECLFVCADVYCSDWASLLGRFRHHISNPDIGVWAPHIDGTAWVDPLVFIRDFGDDGLIQVSQTDALVLGLNAEVTRLMRELDFSFNSHGWGIDWACLAVSISRGLSVVRDMATEVTHIPGSSYSRSIAAAQQEVFLDQLSDAEKAILALMKANHTVNRKVVRRILKLVAFAEELSEAIRWAVGRILKLRHK